MTSLFRLSYAPLFFAGFVGVACCMTHWLNAPLWTLIPLLGLAIGVSFAAEHYCPFEADWNRARGDSQRDTLHALINESLNGLSLMALPWLAVVLPTLDVWPHHWPVLLQLLLAIGWADLGITLMHRASHRYALLWRLHAVHHSPKRLYGFNGLMKHPLHQSLEALAGLGPLLLIGLPVSIASLLAFAIGIQLLLQHSNVDIRVGMLNRLFAWAPVHRYHHIKYGRAGDVNFALFFSFWDHLFGTAFKHPDARVQPDDLGIGSQPDYPDAYLDQLLHPFRTRNKTLKDPQLPPHLVHHRMATREDGPDQDPAAR